MLSGFIDWRICTETRQISRGEEALEGAKICQAVGDEALSLSETDRWIYGPATFHFVPFSSRGSVAVLSPFICPLVKQTYKIHGHCVGGGGQVVGGGMRGGRWVVILEY